VTFREQILQYIVTGLTTGAIYALLAVGFVAIKNVADVINFAQGETAMLGAMLLVTFHVELGWPLLPSFVMAVAIVALIGGVLYRFTLWPARDAPRINSLIITIGARIVIKGVALIIWGGDPYDVKPFTPGPPLRVWGAVVPLQSLWVMGAMLVSMLGLYLFLQYTKPGRSIRACSSNRMAAQLMGIDYFWVSTLTFALGSALGAVAGAIIAPIALPSYAMGGPLGLKAITAALMGGLTNVPLAVLAGLLLGLLESLSAGLISSGLKNGVAFAILVLILFLRPSGLGKVRLEAHSGL
jgi:branched-chain amino acid transport system permease protein